MAHYSSGTAGPSLRGYMHKKNLRLLPYAAKTAANNAQSREINYTILIPIHFPLSTNPSLWLFILYGLSYQNQLLGGNLHLITSSPSLLPAMTLSAPSQVWMLSATFVHGHSVFLRSALPLLRLNQLSTGQSSTSVSHPLFPFHIFVRMLQYVPPI